MAGTMTAPIISPVSPVILKVKPDAPVAMVVPQMKPATGLAKRAQLVVMGIVAGILLLVDTLINAVVFPRPKPKEDAQSIKIMLSGTVEQTAQERE